MSDRNRIYQHHSNANEGSSSSTSNPNFRRNYSDSLQARIDAFLQEEIVITEIADEYKGLSLDGFFPPVKYDFTDTEWIGKPGITLKRYTDEQIASFGRLVIPMLSSGFSGQVPCAAIFILAYHLRSPDFRSFVFNLDRVLETSSDKMHCEFSNRVNRFPGCYKVIEGSGDVAREAAVYSYIAASLFRLFAKPAASYVKGWFGIMNGFERFYGEKVNVKIPVPTEVAVDHLKRWFDLEARCKVTLYRFLYMSNSDERCKGLKAFLYDKYLLDNGMQVFGIIMKLSEVLKCDPRSIVNAIECVQHEKQVKCLDLLLKMLTRNDENHKMKMWRYGRIFDEKFMSDLQTKSCWKLVYVLAEALRSEEPEKHSGILMISQLADVREDDKWKCVLTAQRLLARLKSQHPQTI